MAPHSGFLFASARPPSIRAPQQRKRWKNQLCWPSNSAFCLTAADCQKEVSKTPHLVGFRTILPKPINQLCRFFSKGDKKSHQLLNHLWLTMPAFSLLQPTTTQASKKLLILLQSMGTKSRFFKILLIIYLDIQIPIVIIKPK